MGSRSRNPFLCSIAYTRTCFLHLREQGSKYDLRKIEMTVAGGIQPCKSRQRGRGWAEAKGGERMDGGGGVGRSKTAGGWREEEECCNLAFEVENDGRGLTIFSIFEEGDEGDVGEGGEEGPRGGGGGVRREEGGTGGATIPRRVCLGQLALR